MLKPTLSIRSQQSLAEIELTDGNESELKKKKTNWKSPFIVIDNDYNKIKKKEYNFKMSYRGREKKMFMFSF